MSPTHLLHSQIQSDISLRSHKQMGVNRSKARAKECKELVVDEVAG